MLKKASLFAVTIAISLAMAACHEDTLKGMPAEVKLNDGTIIDCPGGISVFDYQIFCYRSRVNHDVIKIDKSSIASYSTKKEAAKNPQ